MKVPDKIFLVRDAVNPDGVFDTVASKKPMFQDDIPYIRKDALLEWANRILDCNITSAMRIAVRGLISKINSL